MRTINTESTAFILLETFNEDGELEAANSIDYRIYDMASGQELKASTTITSPASKFKLKIEPASNTLVKATNKKETRIVEFTASFGVGDQYKEAFVYEIIDPAKI